MREEKEICLFPDCGKKQLAIGLCSGHYKQYAKGKDLTTLREKLPKCAETAYCRVEGCNREKYAKHLCKSHYECIRMRLKREKDKKRREKRALSRSKRDSVSNQS